MFESTQLLGFVTAVVVLVLVPGPNTMLILAQSIAGGRSAGLATVLGVEVATLVHTLAAALGLSAVLATSGLVFDVVKYVGAAYLVGLGLRELRQGHHSPALSPSAGRDLSRAFWRAVLNNLTNPKVALFFLAFLPQFVRPERGHLILQFVVLGLIVSGIGLSFGSVLALAAGTVSTWLRNDTFARWQHRMMGVVFLGLGLCLALVRSN